MSIKSEYQILMRMWGLDVVIDINDSVGIKIYYKIIINFSILTKCFCYCIIQDISQKVR